MVVLLYLPQLNTSTSTIQKWRYGRTSKTRVTTASSVFIRWLPVIESGGEVKPDPYRRRPQIFNGARPSSTCARVATHIAAKNADHFTGHIAAFGADRAANAEGVEIESGVDLAGFRGVAVGYHRAGAVLAMSIEQGCNQVAVIVGVNGLP